MTLKTYLENKKLSINAFAKKHDELSTATVWRAVQGRTLRPKTAKLIEVATGGKVKAITMLYPRVCS